jgi:hypothetical protein
MTNDPKEGKGLSKPDKIDAIIELAYNSLPESITATLKAEYQYEKVDTDSGVAISFTVHGHGGAMRCLFPLKPAAEALLSDYASEDEPTMAVAILLALLYDIPFATHIGLENAYDSARLTAIETVEAALSVERQRKVGDTKERRSKILKRMNERNKELVEPPKSGPQAEVSLERLSAAVSSLLHHGTPLDEITAMGIANKLGCEENSVYQSLKRQGTSLKDFLSRYSRWVDN